MKPLVENSYTQIIQNLSDKIERLERGIEKANPSVVTSLPYPAYDQQEVYYVADSTNGVKWHLKYNEGSASAYKWEYVGGSPIWATTGLGDEQLAATTGSWIDTATVPKVTVPLAGDYRSIGHADMRNTTSAMTAFIGLAKGATTPSAQSAVLTNAANNAMHAMCETVLTGLTASGDIRIRFFQGNASSWANTKVLMVVPVRVA